LSSTSPISSREVACCARAVVWWSCLAPDRAIPGFAVLAAALERHIGADASSIMRAPFSLADLLAEIVAKLRQFGREELEFPT
jgi:hypothetical protein